LQRTGCRRKGLGQWFSIVLEVGLPEVEEWVPVSAWKEEEKSGDGSARPAFLTDNPEFTHNASCLALNSGSALNQGKTYVLIFKEGPGSCPVQHDYGVGKSELRVQGVCQCDKRDVHGREQNLYVAHLC
jgi:hypothetical protein